MNLEFIFDIIQQQKQVWLDNIEQGLCGEEQGRYSADALEQLDVTLKHFIKETNKLLSNLKES